MIPQATERFGERTARPDISEMKPHGLFWECSADYLQKIATAILWALEYFPAQDMETSWLATIGKAIPTCLNHSTSNGR